MLDTELSLKDIFGILRRQIRLIGLVVFIGLCCALAYLLASTPVYRATALVLVDPQKRDILDPGRQQSVSGSTENARVDSEVEILRSSATALATIRQTNLVNDPEFGPQLSTREKLLRSVGIEPEVNENPDDLVQGVLARFQNAITIKRRGLTYLISVSVDAKDPERAAHLANAVSQNYINQQLQTKIAASLTARDALQAQSDNARDRLARSEDALDLFISQNIDRLEAENGTDEISLLRQQLNTVSQSRLASEVQAASAQAALSVQDWSTLSETLGDEAIRSLALQRQQLQDRLAGRDPSDMTTADLSAEILRLEQSLQYRALNGIETLKTEIASFDQSVDQLQGQIRQTLLQGQMSSDTIAQVFTLQQEASIARRQYQNLLSRLRDLEAQAALQIADSQVVSEALPPTKPISPNTRLTLAFAIVAALGIGLALALLNEYHVGGVGSAAQLKNVTRSSQVIRLPALTGKSVPGDQIIDAPLSAYAEAMRRLRAELDISLHNKKGAKVILVTSAIPSEGKTSTALALARTCALAGQDTLLIDCDLRKPSLHQQLGRTPDSGFMQYLQDPKSNGGDYPEFYQRDARSPAAVIMGCGQSDVPTDQLLSSGVFEKLIHDAKKVTDVIILDSAPLLSVVDTRYIARHADAIVMSVRHASTPQSDVRMAMNELMQVIEPDVPVISVLNVEDAKRDMHRTYGYYVDQAA
ncbi:GumC family protein [Pseudaestuariivita rosea]|uniref:GumC family protein n=1 Tax=Pseudaestuariivita rosea TaxID=2763263 RepID=UPI001ABA914F|nr:Wzz/FepE/Etk N-terminal domain-containing protein [Pseudaestuariivita rosea]